MTVIDPTPYTHHGVPLSNLFEQLAASAANSLLQTPRGAAGDSGFYHDQPVEDCCDSMLLWVRQWLPVVKGDFPATANVTDLCRPIQMQPELVLSLRRPCAPAMDETGGTDPAEEHAVAKDLMVDAVAVQCAVFSEWPGLIEAAGFATAARLQYGAMTTTGANTNCLGWDWPITLEVNGCLGGCGG